MLHLVAKTRRHSNGFRITISLRDAVCPKTLQKAVDRITPRFPCVIAGIRPGPFWYRLVPAQTPPVIRPDTECLAPMNRGEIRTCAVRFLYQGHQISAEFFHALTDGHGGMVVLHTLVAAYLELRYGCKIPVSLMTLAPDAEPSCAELADDYLTYAAARPKLPCRKSAYQLSGHATACSCVQTTARLYTVDDIRAAAHHYGVSITMLLGAVMAASLLRIQCSRGKRQRPIQIMIPVNLRKLFESCTLRNFVLYALLRVPPAQHTWTFEALTQLCKTQMQEQNTAGHMSAVMAGTKSAARFPLLRILPLPLKLLLLRAVYSVYGERTSCISLSNLGVISLPLEMQEYVAGVDFLLTPRIKSPYNCGVVTYDDVLSIHFTRLCPEPELEEVFFSTLDGILKSNERSDKNETI